MVITLRKWLKENLIKYILTVWTEQQIVIKEKYVKWLS